VLLFIYVLFILQNVSVTFVTIFRVSVDKNTINILTKYMQHVCEAASQIYTHCIDVGCKFEVKMVKFSRYKPEPAVGGSGRLRLCIFMTFGTMKVVRSSPLRTGRLYPQEFYLYLFLEAVSTPGHMVLSVASEKISSDTTGDRSRDLPISSAAP
jgi:hypothetical protein